LLRAPAHPREAPTRGGVCVVVPPPGDDGEVDGVTVLGADDCCCEPDCDEGEAGAEGFATGAVTLGRAGTEGFGGGVGVGTAGTATVGGGGAGGRGGGVGTETVGSVGTVIGGGSIARAGIASTAATAAQPSVEQSFRISRLYNSNRASTVTTAPREGSQFAAFPHGSRAARTSLCRARRRGPPGRRAGRMQTQRAKDYYAVLGVPAAADEETIRKAFRSLARELHPDVSAAADAEARFREVAEAYQVLSKPGAKRLYDRIGYRGRGNGGFASSSRDPLYEFWRMSRRRRPQTVDVEVGHFEAARGARRTVEVDAREPCTDCNATGAADGAETAVCAACEGSGRLKNVSPYGGGRMLRVDPCPECVGTGRSVSTPCATCSGVGDIWKRRKIDVKIPAAVEDGTRIRLAHAAGNADAYVRVSVLDPPRDPAWIRYGALVALLAAVAFLVYVVLR
jgi:hypothetical protein